MATNAIKTISFSRLKNAHHVGFHSMVASEIDKYEFDKLGIDEELYTRYKSGINRMQDIVNRSMASEFTVRMAQLDGERDDIFRRCIYLVRAAVFGKPTETITQEVINGLKTKIIDLYPLSIADGGNQEETAKIRGFIKDMQMYFDNELEALGVVSSLAELGTANDKYEEAFLERIREQSSSANSSEVRSACDDAYMQISFYLNSMANIQTTTPELKVKARYCNQVVDEINTLISYWQNHYYSKAATTEAVDTEDVKADGSVNDEPETTEES